MPLKSFLGVLCKTTINVQEWHDSGHNLKQRFITDGVHMYGHINMMVQAWHINDSPF